MANTEDLKTLVEKSFNIQGPSIVLGTAKLDDTILENILVKAPLRMFNRHGLIAGATGTGKTKTLQNLAEKLSANGVPTLLMDIKGDLSGISQAGTINPKIEERHSKIGVEWKAAGFPTELLSISGEKGVRMRATISEFGPVLLSKILELNDVQSGVVSIIFKYCDDKKMPLLDIKDFRKVCQYFQSDEGRNEIEKEYGLVSSSSVGAIMRNILEVEQQGADVFFGERSFEVNDLLRHDANGNGYCNILRLTDIQSKPALFSTFMLCLLAEIYETFPERGDMDKPQLCIFIDEAHLIFDEASKSLLNQITTIVKLIRSKGVGLFFITQDPTDVPDEVLGQLGMKMQHALRAFTEKDRKAIKTIAENFPPSDFYKTSDLLTALGIGEALVTVLDEKGIPTPLVHAYLTAPQSRMDVISAEEQDALVRNSELVARYNEEIDRESAFEILTQKLEAYSAKATKADGGEEDHGAEEGRRKPNEKSTVEKVMNSSVTRVIVREVARGLLGVLGIKSSSRRKSSSWF
jgi:DNA helicase HerA-like ATPase